MPAGDRVLQIVPHLPGTFDGVGDYALNLARGLSDEHGIATTFLVAAQTAAESRDGFPVVSGFDAKSPADLAGDHRHVILHYVNYGYQSRGVPFSLRRFCQGLRRELSGHWATMFHELYASGPPWKSAFWLRPFQVGIARSLIDISDACIVSNLPIEREIYAYAPEKRIRLLPVMSNFGEPEFAALDATSPRRWAICGGTALVERSLVLFENLSGRIPDFFTPKHLDVVGGRVNASITAALERLKQRAGLSVHHYPEVSVDLASELLRRSSFGWIDYFGSGRMWPGMLLKSTAFAALCAHGVVPVLSHGEEPIAVDGDPAPGPYFITTESAQLPSLDDLAAVRRRYYEWYQAHAHSRRAARLYAEILK
jgi:hypothetical protein